MVLSFMEGLIVMENLVNALLGNLEGEGQVGDGLAESVALANQAIALSFVYPVVNRTFRPGDSGI
jgi:hypothetical protein